MAGESQQVSSLPMPPKQYVSLYGSESIRLGRAPPPPPPIQDTYSMFGVTFHVDDLIIRPLESQGIKRLYPQNPQNFDHKRELKKLNHSILVNFLEMLDILIRAPATAKRKEKIDDLNLLFIHMHHLINEFRPHQARETLRVMLEVQKRQRLETAERFQMHLDSVGEKLQACLASLPDAGELDCRLLAAAAPAEDAGAGGGCAGDACDSLDKLMCDLVDLMH
ncbi:PREDICTED: mediator of RNA polymerase II transcription subunit 7-like [Priapulus caudatus]|uniref:Mediator of RNA polymerase II transcription subunit 7 n=1 Tax=Priapulus caudatus TaxID=37621 RepID=A0ABM1DZP4_PRICU|nr:PREDICTED: mediator of RNA polymerase II transcription subunit 7-like [Priapulus caudatus]